MAEAPPLLRSEGSGGRKGLGVAFAAAAGAGAAALVALGNPGNMGVCGACFLRDAAGALGFHASPPGPAYLRPEVVGVVVGATAFGLARGRWTARSGGYGAARFLLGVWMAIAALVFLGCPFRLLQRLGGGDLNAWLALPAFVVGVGLGLVGERRGYTIGRTAPAPAAVGALGPLVLVGALALFLGGALRGPGPGSAAPPPHAPWSTSLGIALGVGVLLSASGFCAVTAARQVFQRGRKAMLVGSLALVAGYAAVAFATGRFRLSQGGQPIAHSDLVSNIAALGLLGYVGALAGGCPVRQLVMAGEGNGDAWLAVLGLLVGGSLAHNLGLVSSAKGATEAGRIALGIGWAFAAVFATWVIVSHRRAAARAPDPPA